MENGLTVTLDEACAEARRYILRGSIGTIDANVLSRTLEKDFMDGHTRFVLDMMQVAFLSSTGIRVILMFWKKTKECGGSFRVENPSENVTNVLGISNLNEMLSDGPQ